MIFDTLAHGHWYYSLDPRLERGLRWLATTDLTALPLGKHPIEAEHVVALVSDYETRPVSEAKWEAHCRYWEIQVLARGTECLGHAPLAAMRETVAYDAAHDIAWFAGEGHFVTLRPGQFVVFAPHDVHAPGLAVAAPLAVRKIVVKVEVVPR